MAYVASGNHTQVIKGSVKSFKERAAVLQEDLKKIEARKRECEQGIKVTRVREYKAKQELTRMKNKMQDIDERMEKIERSSVILKERLHQARRRTQDNLDTRKSLEGSKVDLEQVVKDIHQAYEYGALMRKKKNAVLKDVQAFEQKIEKAERRCTKADNRAYLITEKMATHKHLLANPQVSRNYVVTGNEECDRKANRLREKLMHAVLRARKSEHRAMNLENKADVLETSLENYERRNRDFQQSKRELMSSKLF